MVAVGVVVGAGGGRAGKARMVAVVLVATVAHQQQYLGHLNQRNHPRLNPESLVSGAPNSFRGRKHEGHEENNQNHLQAVKNPKP